MSLAVRNAIAFMGSTLVDVARMASLLPAELCGAADRKGSIEVGKEADLAVFDAEFKTRWTIQAGNVVYRG